MAVFGPGMLHCEVPTSYVALPGRNLYRYRDRVLLHTHLRYGSKVQKCSTNSQCDVCDDWTTPIILSAFVYCMVMLTIRSLYYEKSFFWVEWPWTTIKDYIHLTALQGLQASTGTCTKPRRGAEPHFSRIFKDQQDMVLLGHPTQELLVDTFTTFKPGWWTIQSGWVKDTMNVPLCKGRVEQPPQTGWNLMT